MIHHKKLGKYMLMLNLNLKTGFLHLFLKNLVLPVVRVQ